jgi:hypothetical protein
MKYLYSFTAFGKEYRISAYSERDAKVELVRLLIERGAVTISIIDKWVEG